MFKVGDEVIVLNDTAIFKAIRLAVGKVIAADQMYVQVSLKVRSLPEKWSFSQDARRYLRLTSDPSVQKLLDDKRRQEFAMKYL